MINFKFSFIFLFESINENKARPISSPGHSPVKGVVSHGRIWNVTYTTFIWWTTFAIAPPIAHDVNFFSVTEGIDFRRTIYDSIYFQDNGATVVVTILFFAALVFSQVFFALRLLLVLFHSLQPRESQHRSLAFPCCHAYSFLCYLPYQIY